MVIRPGDARHALQQDLVGHLERVEHAGLVVGDGEQAIVRDDDQRVDLLLQPLDAVVGLNGATATLERERAGDDADGQRTCLAGDLGDHGSSARTGATTFAGGDEHHVGATHHLFDLVVVRLGGRPTHLGVAAGTEASREIATDVELDVGVAHQQRLSVGVDGDELHALQPGVDHAVHGVDATATDADDLDDGKIVLRGADHQQILHWFEFIGSIRSIAPASERTGAHPARSETSEWGR